MDFEEDYSDTKLSHGVTEFMQEKGSSTQLRGMNMIILKVFPRRLTLTVSLRRQRLSSLLAQQGHQHFRQKVYETKRTEMLDQIQPFREVGLSFF